MLYIRMFLIMGVTFYTTRVILQELGVKDYGIYNAVGGVVVLLAFLNNAMVTATQRFLNFELGRGNIENLRRSFSMSLTAHFSIALLVLVLAESIGLWFFYAKMNIPADRMNAALWVFHFSVLTMLVNIIRAPYNACIIAYERMDFYAYLSIAEVFLKLAVVYLLKLNIYDSLILYAVLTFVVSCVMLLVYKLYCNQKFSITIYQFFWDKALYIKLAGFSGWSLLGNMANVGAQQGINLLLNLFSGVVVNAAAGISNQVSQAIYSFVSNFQTAFNPQIVKAYARQDKPVLKSLIFRTSKISYFLLFVFAFPLFLYCDSLLGIWLEEVPPHAANFCRLMLVYLLIDSISAPLWISVQATGNIYKYQIVVSILILLNLPLSYCLLKMGYAPETVFMGRVLINIIVFMFRFLYVKNLISITFKEYTFKVFYRILGVTLATICFAFLLYSLDLHAFFSIPVLCLSTAVAVFFVGFTNSERVFLVTTVLSKIKK